MLAYFTNHTFVGMGSQNRCSTKYDNGFLNERKGVNVVKKVWLCAVVMLCLGGLRGYAEIKWDAEKFMPLSEVTPGMRGKGYTVFSGITVEEFDYEIVNITYNFYPGWHVVWCEGLSDNFKRVGVAGGMSGSPMYVDGRLMGALSLGYFNQREHSNIFGVTPFELMVKITERGMEPNLSYEGTQLFNLNPETATAGLDVVASLFNDGKIVETQPAFDVNLLENISSISPRVSAAQLQTPIALPILNSDMMHILKPLFDKFNFIPVQSAGGGSAIKKSPVEEAQTIGTELVRGDVSFFGYGTITYIDGNQFLAYGHPSFAEGNVNMPASGGAVNFVFPSRTRSFKVAVPTQPIGTLVQDREPAIAGIIGKHPSYLPVNVTLQTSDGKQHEKYYEVVRHRSFTPLYSGVGAWYFLDALEFYSNEHTLNFAATINLKEQAGLTSRELTFNNVFSSRGSPGMHVMNTLMLPMLQLINNSYTKVEVENITLNLKVEDKRRAAVVVGIQIDKLRYHPGETVGVELTLKPYLERTFTQTGTITIPKDTPDGIVTLIAANANSYEFWERSRAPLNFRPKNINHLVELLQLDERNTDVILELFVPKPGLTVQGEEFANLPTSVMSVMNTAKQLGQSGYTTSTRLQRNKISTDYVISGSGFMRFAVDRNAQ